MSSLRRIAAVVALLLATLMVVPAGSVNAQIPLPLPTQPAPDPTPDPDPGPTTEPSPDPRPTSSPEPGNGDGPTKREPSRRKTAAPYQPSPAERRAIDEWVSREHTGSRTTTRLLELLERAKPGDAPLRPSEARAGFGRFPVVGYVWYQDDYGAPRYSGTYEFHAGTDLFAVSGTPVTSVVDGTIWRLGSFSRGGNAIWLQGDDGVRYYYGHLFGYRDDLKVGTRVAMGELLGWVGATGQARGYPHVHFEVNPGGLGTVNPKPILDSWLSAAETSAVQHIATLRRLSELAPLGAARWDNLFDIMGEAGPVAPALWTAAWDGSATLAGLDLVLADLAASTGWDTPPASSGQRRLDWDHVLDPILADHDH